MYDNPAYTFRRSGAPNQYGLPDEYGDKLFTNLQSRANDTRLARRQAVIDNTSGNPAMAGAQQHLLRLADRDAADAALNQNTQAQLHGVQEGLQDRRLVQARTFEGQQNEENRKLQRYGIDTQATSARESMEAQRQWAILQSILGSVGTVAGAAMGARAR